MGSCVGNVSSSGWIKVLVAENLRLMGESICVTDGYQVYHNIEKECEDLRIAGCWNHARRRFGEAFKALPKDKQKSWLVYLTL